ncbi:MAG: type II toxin-antitoxin system prevent-host-death family antitoxin [Nitrosomonas sp.]|nr:type II toxin-antitoxin system prevent-host-death family antitoxin [Nitrosomonas sp.]
MIEVGAFEAKTHLSALLDKVKNGEEVLITKRGKAIARLVPAEQAEQSKVNEVIDTLSLLRKQVHLNGLDWNWKGLRDDGRR